MKLFLNPRTGASRSVLMFVHEHEPMLESHQIELAADGGEGRDDEPLLIDGDLVLNQSPAILRYLAEHSASPAYPAPKRSRARVDAAMDWIHADLTRVLCHGYLYPKLLAGHRHANVRTQSDVEARGLALARTHLTTLDAQMREEGLPFLCGEQISLADYVLAGVLGYADACGLGLSEWPRVQAWLRRMKSRPSWGPTHYALPGPANRRRWLSALAHAAYAALDRHAAAMNSRT